MIKLIPSKIEAYDTDSNGEASEDMFIVESVDESTCNIRITTVVSNASLEEILAAIRSAVMMLELE